MKIKNFIAIAAMGIAMSCTVVSCSDKKSASDSESDEKEKTEKTEAASDIDQFCALVDQFTEAVKAGDVEKAEQLNNQISAVAAEFDKKYPNPEKDLTKEEIQKVQDAMTRLQSALGGGSFSMEDAEYVVEDSTAVLEEMDVEDVNF